MSQSFRWTVLWIAAAMVGVISALMMLTASHVDGVFQPSHADAFYHGRRILDAVMTGQPVIQFDSMIHVPEGSWLTWPWGFDQALAWITEAFGPFASRADAARVLMNIPPFALPITVGLVVLIVRQLALPLVLAALLVLAFAGLPMVWMHFGVGNLDHHFAELTWTQATLCTGLWFFREGRVSPWSGVALGAVLGSAMAIHNGLFILQIPVAATLALLWVRGLPMPDFRRVALLSATLVGTTLLACLPSIPWQRGFFEFYTLSWFHFYVSACTAIFALLVARLPLGPRNISIVVVAAALALLPIIGTLPFAKDFLTGEMEAISNVIEAKSPYRLYFEEGPAISTRALSWFMWVSALFALLNVWWVVRRRESPLQFIALFGTLTILLMQSQYRFSVFGVFSLLLTPVLATKFLIERFPQLRTRLVAACYLSFLVAYVPTIGAWQLNWIPGGQASYANVRGVFRQLAPLCDARPGVVLGDIDTGHWVRYHTNCSVIADVFLLTRQHAEKAIEARNLMDLTPQQLLDSHANVTYVIAYHGVDIGLDVNGHETPNLEELRQIMRPLERDLLGPEDRIPPRFKKQYEIRTPAGRIMARLYEILPPS